jgi:hypothetical protein
LLESQLANTVSANTVESLKRKHVEELQGLQAQAVQAQELETELVKVRGAESSLWLEFDRQLAEEKRILSAKYDSEVNELCTTLGSEIESRGAQINELETLRKLDSERHDKEIGVWHARDRRVQSGLLGLEEALRGILPFLLLNSCSFTPPPHSLITPTGAFPDSNKAATAVLEEYRTEQKIVPSSDPKAELSSGELVVLAKGRLHPVAKLGGDLHEAIISIFKTLWPRRAVPGKIQALL